LIAAPQPAQPSELAGGNAGQRRGAKTDIETDGTKTRGEQTRDNVLRARQID
jgi:hypothetical protein